MEFSTADQIVARSILKRLPPAQKKAVVLRFWHNYSIFEIAKALRISWSEADSLLRAALLKMKKDCLGQPQFSRSQKLSLVA